MKNLLRNYCETCFIISWNLTQSTRNDCPSWYWRLYIYTTIIHNIPIIYYYYYWKSAAHHESVIVAQMRWFHGWPPSNRWPRFALIGGLCYLVLEPLGGSPTCAGLNRLLPATSPITTPPTWEEYPSGDRFLGLLKWRSSNFCCSNLTCFSLYSSQLGRIMLNPYSADSNPLRPYGFIAPSPTNFGLILLQHPDHLEDHLSKSQWTP